MAKTQGPTYRPSKIKRIRKFGFRKRMAKWTGINIVSRRRAKKRTKLSVGDDAAFSNKMQKNKRFKRRK